ncbi:MAG: hypothetical protein JNG83_07395 [Opitutaceae bacterium]|nr:hypothetical protein [Opitutaceae bacterium]
MKRIVIDSFFHMMPGHRLSRNIFTGGYRTNYGRYSPFDVYHPNGASMLYSDLLASYDIRLLNQPYSEMTLADADILMIPNPDYPLYEGTSPYRIDAPDITALLNFLNRGGSVILMLNSFLSRADFWEENFDFERVTPLLDRLGVRWDHDFMSDDNNILPAVHGQLKVGYGQGGRVLAGRLPAGAEPLLTYDGQTFGFVVKSGRGRLAVVGDAGLVSNGLYHFPGFDNAAFLAKLFADMAPAWTTGAAQGFECFEFGHLSCGTSELGVSEKLFRSLRPQARFEIDHHYRHLTYESAPVRLPGAAVAARLPVRLEAAAGRRRVTGRFPFVNVTDGRPTAEGELALNVAERKSGAGTDYVISGTAVNESLGWDDIGADPAVFGAIGQLARVNTVVQILAGTNPDGSLRHYSVKQGQILYARNARNPHYGFDILLGSRNAVYAPAV